MSHANAALMPRHCLRIAHCALRIARLVVDGGWPVVHAAHQFNVSWPKPTGGATNTGASRSTRELPTRLWPVTGGRSRDRQARPRAPNQTPSRRDTDPTEDESRHHCKADPEPQGTCSKKG